MKMSSLMRYLLLATVLAAITTCSGSATGQTSGSSSTSPLLYVGTFLSQFVNVYNAGQAAKGPTRQLLDDIFGSLPGDIVVDQGQKVYVSEVNRVVVYPRAGLVPESAYLFPDMQSPLFVDGIAVDREGTLYAALEGRAVVAAYTKANLNQASLVIPVPQGPCAPFFCSAFAVAVDGAKNVYIEYGAEAVGVHPGFIEKCAPGSTQCAQLGITLGDRNEHLALDSQGNLIACDSSVPQIDVFPPGSTQPRVISQGLLSCTFFSLSQDETQLYVSNNSSIGANQGVAVFDYASGAPVGTITKAIPLGDFIRGIAFSPAAQ